MEFTVVIVVFLLVCLILLSHMIASLFEQIAKAKGYTSRAWYWFCFFLWLPG